MVDGPTVDVCLGWLLPPPRCGAAQGVFLTVEAPIYAAGRRHQAAAIWPRSFASSSAATPISRSALARPNPDRFPLRGGYRVGTDFPTAKSYHRLDARSI